MKRLHLVVGVLSLIAFVLTGQYMRHVYPEIEGMEDGMRLLLRSRHLYIMLTGALNAGLGIYLTQRTGWRRVAQWIGSGLIMIAPVILLVAFFVEPSRGIRAANIAVNGLVGTFAGIVLHLLSAIPVRTEGPAPEHRRGAEIR
jgi:hypothetical protein